MATGRTVSANFLTEKDKKIIGLCEKISLFIKSLIRDDAGQRAFLNEYGKVSYTRDGGAGVGAGKLQRDALCTRGRQGKAPFSNRNLRWHPLVAADTAISFAKEIDAIHVIGRDEAQTLVFIVDGEEYPSDRVHELKQRYVALPKHWLPHVDKLKHWSDTLWTQNSCIVPALEACDWHNAVETFAVLAIAVSVAIYRQDYRRVHRGIVDILSSQGIEPARKLPSSRFPVTESEIVNCPMCKVSVTGNAADRPDRTRCPTWQPAWRSVKRGEGEDSSIQIMHINPLIESGINHTVANVRYGHRWCNVAMTDHSLEETVDFMEYIVRAHGRMK
jgi:hypothetical protein